MKSILGRPKQFPTETLLKETVVLGCRELYIHKAVVYVLEAGRLRQRIDQRYEFRRKSNITNQALWSLNDLSHNILITFVLSNEEVKRAGKNKNIA